MACNGIEVKVITAPPYYPGWKILEGYRSLTYKREKLGEVDVLRCPIWVPKKPTGLRRILHLLSFASSAFIPVLWGSLRWRPQWIMVLEPPLMCLPGALLAGALSRSKTWLHIQDYEVDAAFELGILKSNTLKRFALYAERWLMRRCYFVSTISQRMLERLDDKRVEPDKCFLFPNWVDTEHIRPISSTNTLRNELNISEFSTILLYSGNMGEKQGLDLIADVASVLADDPKYVFVLCGDGSARNRLVNKTRDLANVRFIQLQPAERFNELMNLADIHLLPQRADAEDLVMPSKLTAMLASGKPVITTARLGTQVANVVEDCGLVVPPADLDALRAAIVQLGADAELRARLGAEGRKYATSNCAKDVVMANMLARIGKNN